MTFVLFMKEPDSSMWLRMPKDEPSSFTDRATRLSPEAFIAADQFGFNQATCTSFNVCGRRPYRCWWVTYSPRPWYDRAYVNLPAQPTGPTSSTSTHLGGRRRDSG